MKMLSLFANSVTFINRWVAYCCLLIIFIIVGLISYDVFCRYFLNQPTDWAMELSTMLFGPYFLLCGGYLLSIKAHVNVDIIYDKLANKAKRWLDLAIYLIILLLCIVFIKISLPLAIESFHSAETSFTSWNPMLWPIKVTIPISLFLLALQAVAESIYAMIPSKERS